MLVLDDIIEGIMLREGTAFTDRPADRGGPTCCGVTLATYAAYRAPLATTIEDLKKLTPTTARPVYQHVFIEAPGFKQIMDPELAALMVDAGVQHGVENAIEMLQRAVGVTVDGHLGPISLAAVNADEPRSLRALICGARIRLYGLIISHDPKLGDAVKAGYRLQAENAFGWGNRIAQFVETLA